MRKNLFFGILMALIVGVTFSACSSDDDNGNVNTNIDADELRSIATNGTWRISSYLDDGENETQDFTDYNVTFNPSGTLAASNETNTLNGTWEVVDNDSSDDDSSDNDVHFVIFFNVPPSANFADLNDDWEVASYTDSRIDLTDTSGGDGGTDTLVLEKN